MTHSEHFDRAIARFDALNAEDPSRELLEGGDCPKALLYAERLSAMLARIAPDSSEALRLAARCQHLQRWKIPRANYPMTQAGYFEWRARLRDFHVDLASTILADAGYDDAAIARVNALTRKEALRTDADAQALEDAVALVFLESELADFVARHPDYDEAKLAGILTKTAKKMSAQGREAALTTIALPAALAPLVRSAMQAVRAPRPLRRAE